MKLLSILLIFASITISCCELSLFRPFAFTRQIKKTSSDSNNNSMQNISSSIQNQSVSNVLSKLEEVQSTKENSTNNMLNNEQNVGQSIGSTISQTLIRLVDEFEIQLESHLNQSESKVKSETKSIENNENHMKSNSLITDRFISHTMNNGTQIDKSSKGLREQATNFEESTTRPLSILSKGQLFSTSHNTSPIDLVVHSKTRNDSRSKRKAVSNQLATSEPHQIRNVFRTFGSIVDFVVDMFDEFAEALIERIAKIAMSGLFDQLSQLMLGI